MFVAGNWKMNTTVPEGRRLARSIAEGLEERGGRFETVDLAVCPPFVHLPVVAEVLADTPVAVGGQDMHAEDEGAFTGDISAGMLASAGCTYVILGHSERRQYYDEADEDVNRKVKQAHRHDLMPIVCVGETLEQRKAGDAEGVVRAQLDGALANVDVAAPDQLVVAYEPVWAIGTGESATPSQAQSMHALIRDDLTERYGDEIAGGMELLYGGSMKPHNAAELTGQPDVDGGLVGSASLEADSFLGIADRAAAVTQEA